jgi:selenide,water dikinase
LLGHLREMAAGSNVDVEIDHAELPIIEGAADLATGGTVPGGTLNNKSFVEPHVSWDERVSETNRILACDAQTSGGLLAALPEQDANDALAALKSAGIGSATIIGRFRNKGPGRISVH